MFDGIMNFVIIAALLIGGFVMVMRLMKEAGGAAKKAGKGAGKAARGAGSGLGSMFRGLGSGVGSAIGGVGDGLGNVARGVAGGAGAALQGVASALPAAGQAAVNALTGLGVGAAAVGAGCVRAAKGAGRRAKSAANYVKEDAMAGFTNDTPSGWNRPPAWSWPVGDKRDAQDIGTILSQSKVPHQWKRDPETGEWRVSVPNGAIRYAEAVLHGAGWDVDEPGAPTDWMPDDEAEVPEWTWQDGRRSHSRRNDGGQTVQNHDDDVIDAEWRDVSIPVQGSSAGALPSPQITGADSHEAA